jgi:type I restriction enzyme S subunit
MRYPTHKIGEFAKVKGGKRLPKGESLVANKTAHPYIRARDIRDGSVSFDDPIFVPDEIFERIQHYIVKTNDVCITIVGANVGDVGIVPQFLDGANLTENAVKLTDLKDCDPFYLKYGLMLDGPQEQMKLLAAGAAQPKLGLYKVKEVKIPFPPLPTQRKIAAILSAYDDLIENNTRRIAILEDMAQAIYREWFVHFRFPGHEGVRMVESELGPMPEGWEVKFLKDACTILMGQSPKSDYYNEEGDGLPFHQGVKDFGDRFPNDRVYCTLLHRIAEAGDILFSVRAPVGRINIANKRIVIGRGLCAIRNDAGNQCFTFHQLKEIFQEEDIMGGGTIFKAVTKDEVHSLKFLAPPRETIAAFETVAVPISHQIQNLVIKNGNLRQTRDLLLPRLVSGELDVSELEINSRGLDG